MEIIWKNLKNGFRGFEKLATEYVQKNYNYNNLKWEKTAETRDGNKDAVALILGYRESKSQEEQWWMEAKYSEKKKLLTRYRLDATIVSAILEDHVSRVIFVTNTLIRAKTILDIRRALSKSIHCSQVDFCTRYTLEYWLKNNVDYYRDYFHTNDSMPSFDLDVPEMFVTQEVDYYSEAGQCFAFQEPLRYLYIGRTYVGYFNLFSPKDTTVQLRVHPDIKGVKLLSTPKFQVHTGENPLSFHFYIKENYGPKAKKKDAALHFRINGLDLLSHGFIEPKEYTGFSLQLPIQEDILKKLKNDLKKFIHTNDTLFICLEGKSGMGKSYLLEKFIEEGHLTEENVFFYDFTESTSSNYKALVQIVLFLLLPYVSPDSIDAEYLEKLNKAYINKTMIRLIKEYNNFEMLSILLAEFQMSDDIIPNHVSINRRIIILDDLQKLNETGANFFIAMLLDLWKKKIPVMVIMAAQPTFYACSSFLCFKEHCVFTNHNCDLTLNDIIQSLQKNKELNLTLCEDILLPFQTNVLELFAFSKYLIDEERIVSALEDFIYTYRLFKRSKIMEKHVISSFNNIFSRFAESRTLCDAIYWRYEPVEYCQNQSEIISALIEEELVKLNSNDCLIPFHDLYKEFYHMHFKPESSQIISYPTDSPEYLNYCITYSYQKALLQTTACKIHELLDQKQYYTVLYILQETFENTGNKTALKNKAGEDIYYSLYLSYALAAHQQTLHLSCEKIFEELYKETRYAINSSLLNICLNSTWELAVIAFEYMEYEKAGEMLEQVQSLILKIHKLEHDVSGLESNIFYHRTLGQNMLMRADHGEIITDEYYKHLISNMKGCGFPYLCQGYRARYAVILSAVDPPKCISLLDEGRKELKEQYGDYDKHYLWCEFYYYFYKLIWENDEYYLSKMLQFHEKMRRDQNGNYRKKLFAIAAYFYSRQDLVNGNRFLFKDVLFSNTLRPRYEAFYQTTLSLYEILNGNLHKACYSLEKAAAIFHDFPDYSSIPLHNLEVINNGLFQPEKVSFWFGETKANDTFYFDPRSAW